MSDTVRNLRVLPRPYDHQIDEDAISVEASSIVWSLIHQACRTSPIAAVRDAGEIVAAQVCAVNEARFRAEIIDARSDYLDGA